MEMRRKENVKKKENEGGKKKRLSVVNGERDDGPRDRLLYVTVTKAT